MFHIDIDQRRPDAVKDFVDVRFELEGSDVEKAECTAGLADGHSIQLGPGLFQQVEGIEDAPLVPRLLDEVQGAAHGLDASKRILHLLVVVELAGEEFGSGFCLADGLAGGLWGFGFFEYVICEGLGSEDIVLHRLGIRLPRADIVGRLFIDRMHFGLQPSC